MSRWRENDKEIGRRPALHPFTDSRWITRIHPGAALHIFFGADEVTEIRFVLSDVIGRSFEDRVEIGTSLAAGKRDEQEGHGEWHALEDTMP